MAGFPVFCLNEGMIIGIDARELCDRPAGKGQYLLRVVAQWVSHPELMLVLYTKPGQIVPAQVIGPTVKQVEVPGRGLLWHRAVSRHLLKDKVAVFFAALSYQSSLWNKVPTVTVVHDLAVFRLPGLAHNRRAKWVERLTLKQAVKRSVALIAVSDSTKDDLVELMGADPQKVEVFYEAALLGATGNPLSRLERGGYFLFTGTLEPRKNVSTLLRAYALLPQEIRYQYRLKLAGKPGWGGEDYRALAGQLGVGENCDFLGYVSDSELEKLFRQAYALVYPSFYEGFGLPVIEAMACGTPVVTSNISSLPEVVGPEGLTASPHDPAAVVALMLRLVSEPALWDRQSQYLYLRSTQFNWEVIANQVVGSLERAVADPVHPPLK